MQAVRRKAAMDFGEFLRRAVLFVVIVVVVILLGSVISRLASLLILVFACWVFSVGLNYAVLRLQRYGLSRMAAILVTLLGTLLVFVLAIAIILPAFVEQIASLVASLPAAVESLVQRYEQLRLDSDLAAQVLPEFTLEQYQTLIETQFEEVIPDTGATTAINLNALFASALPLLGGIGSFVGSLLANLFLLLFITLYLLADPLVYYRAVLAMVPTSSEARAVEIINDIRRAIVAWMGALTISILFVGGMTTFVLGVVLQIPNAVALGVIAGLSSFIPNLGYYIGLIPIVVFTAAHNPLLVIPAFIAYVVINETDGKVIQPRVVQNTLSIPAGVVLPFQIISASLFGFFGIMLAVPILAIVIILVREVYVAELAGKRKPATHLEENTDGDLVLVYDHKLPPPSESVPVPAGAD
ncbi:AI-2E family transporter [bacterium]|nr:AI-2E family transporter [bacterium]